MKVRDGFSQRFRNVGKHSLEVSESLTCIIGIFGVYGLIRLGTRDEYHDTPVAVSVEPVSLSFSGFEERENFAVDIRFSGFGQFLADMSGDCGNIGLKHFYILENGMIDALQNIVGSICFFGVYFISVVDKSCTQRFDFFYRTLDFKFSYDAR